MHVQFRLNLSPASHGDLPLHLRWTGADSVHEIAPERVGKFPGPKLPAHLVPLVGPVAHTEHREASQSRVDLAEHS